MENSEIRYLGDLQRFEIKPGDKFVLNVGTPVSHETADRIREHWARFAGADVPLLILDRDCKLGAISITKD